MSEPSTRTSTEQILANTLSFLPSLLATVVQVALLLLLFRQWILLEAAQKNIELESQAAKVSQDLRKDFEKDSAQARIAIKTEVEEAERKLKVLIEELKNYTSTQRVNITVEPQNHSSFPFFFSAIEEHASPSPNPTPKPVDPATKGTTRPLAPAELPSGKPSSSPPPAQGIP